MKRLNLFLNSRIAQKSVICDTPAIENTEEFGIFASMEELSTAKRTRGKGRRTIMREAQLALANGKRRPVILDSLEVIERAMMFFYDAAMAELRKKKPDSRRLVELHLNAAAMAKEVAPYRHPKLSAIKIAKRDDDPLEGKTLEQLREEIIAGCEELGFFEGMPVGVASQTPAAGREGRSPARLQGRVNNAPARLPRPSTT